MGVIVVLLLVFLMVLVLVVVAVVILQILLAFLRYSLCLALPCLALLVANSTGVVPNGGLQTNERNQDSMHLRTLTTMSAMDSKITR